jgi:ABC-type glycerol-3-phosphate transport system substrate-binding protein
MKTIRIILAVTATALLAGCAPTIATKTITVTTFANGTKETKECKELTQRFTTPQTASTDDVISSCGK